LRIARLSVLIKKHMKTKQGTEPIEFSELRESCTNQQAFVDLIDERMVAVEDSDAMIDGETRSTAQGGFFSWLQGGSVVHREGATQAPWSCQVDVLVEWTGPELLDQRLLSEAFRNITHQHPMLRARAPPDDSTDHIIGTGSCDVSTLTAATWCLVTTAWSRHWTWQCRISRATRAAVAHALWQCWPRTLVLGNDEKRWAVDPSSSHIKFFTKECEGPSKYITDEVMGFIGRKGAEYWDGDSMVNICVVTLSNCSVDDGNSKSDGSTNGISNGHRAVRQFLYASTSHKYSDGGAAATLVRALGECYEACLRGQKPSPETPALRIQQERLWHYLCGFACPQGTIDTYFQDVNNDLFNHGRGNSSGVMLNPDVCDIVRVAGLRMACSEEIAWLACFVCALCRLMPDEKLIKVLMVHGGRIGDAENVLACTSQYVLLSIPCAGARQNTPVADIASRVKHAVTNGKFTRPEPCEQTHAKINIGGMVGVDGHFSQMFKAHRPRKSGQSRAPFALQLRMDNEGDSWAVKDFKLHTNWGTHQFWQATMSCAIEIAEGWFHEPSIPASHQGWH